MYRLRLKDIRTVVANPLSLPSTDSRTTNYINRACQRLLEEMKAVGTVQRFMICVTNGCITWPREIETIESFSLCGKPAPIRDRWYEWLPHGPGIAQGSCGASQLIDQGEACAFDDILGTTSKLAVYCDMDEGPTSSITLQFYDSNGQWTEETIILPPVGTYAYTTKQVLPKGLARVYKTVTNGTVRLYEYDTTLATLKPLGYYASDEEVPVYRRSLLQGLRTGDSTATCASSTVEVMAKLRFIPVSNDNDFVQISHVEAIRLATQAILKEENNRIQEASAMWAMALRILDKQLSHHKGDGAEMSISMTSLHPSPCIQNLI